MIDLEGLERAMLEGARKDLAPSASDRMRIQSRLVGNPAWFLPAPALRRSVLRGLTRSWRGGLAVGFAVGALLGFGASRSIARFSSPAALDARPAVPASASVDSGAPELLAAAEPARSVVVRGPGAPAAAESIAPALDKSSLAPRARSSGAAPRHTPDTEAAEEGGSTLARELALLQRARRALNRNDALLALGIVQTLDERFPNGVLMEERQATRILSLCQLDRAEEAREQGHRFLLDHPRSVYAERVRRSCAGGR